MCLGAHSDDIEIGCAGIVRLLARRPGGLICRWTVFSASEDRAAEARAAAADVLSDAREATVEVLGFRESYFPAQYAEIKDHVQSVARSFDPHLVLTHFRDDRHQDHRVLAELAWNAFRDQLVLEYEIPKWDGDLGAPNVFVPLSEEEAATKIGTLMAHFGTQRGKSWFDEETFRTLMRLRGMECNAPGRYAEAFYGRKIALAPVAGD